MLEVPKNVTETPKHSPGRLAINKTCIHNILPHAWWPVSTHFCSRKFSLQICFIRCENTCAQAPFCPFLDKTNLKISILKFCFYTKFENKPQSESVYGKCLLNFYLKIKWKLKNCKLWFCLSNEHCILTLKCNFQSQFLYCKIYFEITFF